MKSTPRFVLFGAYKMLLDGRSKAEVTWLEKLQFWKQLPYQKSYSGWIAIRGPHGICFTARSEALDG